jgi:hypothetical protein
VFLVRSRAMAILASGASPGDRAAPRASDAAEVGSSTPHGPRRLICIIVSLVNSASNHKLRGSRLRADLRRLVGRIRGEIVQQQDGDSEPRRVPMP